MGRWVFALVWAGCRLPRCGLSACVLCGVPVSVCAMWVWGWPGLSRSASVYNARARPAISRNPCHGLVGAWALESNGGRRRGLGKRNCLWSGCWGSTEGYYSTHEKVRRCRVEKVSGIRCESDDSLALSSEGSAGIASLSSLCVPRIGRLVPYMIL